MATLEQAYKKGLKILEKEHSKKIRNSVKNKTHWHNRRIISVLKWKKIAKNEIRMLEFIPDDYVAPGEVYFKKGDAGLTQEQEKWFKDYFDYLEYTKNAKYGKKFCEGCILNESAPVGEENLWGIVIKWAIKSKIINQGTCNVVNFFKCPFEQGKNDDYQLFYLEKICQTVSSAMSFAYENTAGNDVWVYDADFEKNIFYAYGKDMPTRLYPGTISKQFRHFRPSKIPLHSAEDRYGILTNRRKLGTVLDQYAESLETENHPDMEQKEKAKQEAVLIRENRQYIIDAIMKIMTGITPEYLRDLYELPKEEIEKERKLRAEIWQSKLKKAQEDGITPIKTVRSGPCVHCNGFANITCINCDVWVCTEHWKEHSISKHNMDPESIEKQRSLEKTSRKARQEDNDQSNDTFF